MDWCYYRDLLHASVFKGGRWLYLSSFSMLKRGPGLCGAGLAVWRKRAGNKWARLAWVSQAVKMRHSRTFNKCHQKHCAWTVNLNIITMTWTCALLPRKKVKRHQTKLMMIKKITFDCRKQHLNPINRRFVTQISGLFIFSLSHFLHSWIPAAGQHTVVYLSRLLKQSLDTNSPSHSHALPPREPFHHPAGIHHFPALTPTSRHCFVWTHRLQAVCLTPTWRCCRRHHVTRVNPEVKTAFLFFPLLNIHATLDV